MLLSCFLIYFSFPTHVAPTTFAIFVCFHFLRSFINDYHVSQSANSDDTNLTYNNMKENLIENPASSDQIDVMCVDNGYYSTNF